MNRSAPALVLSVLLLAGACGRGQNPAYPVLHEEKGNVRVDISSLGAGDCRFYGFPTRSGPTVNIIVYRDGGGNAGVMLDACRTCYRWKRGYRFSAGRIVCARCDLTFPLEGIKEGTGSCVPIAVPATVEGTTLVIPASLLERGARFF